LVSDSVGTDEGSFGGLHRQLDLDRLLGENLIDHLLRDAEATAMGRVAVLIVLRVQSIHSYRSGPPPASRDRRSRMARR